MTGELLIRPHLGMGDAIISNGLVRQLAVNQRIAFPCKTHYAASVRFMFRDVPSVTVIPVADDSDADLLVQQASQLNLPTLLLGMFVGLLLGVAMVALLEFMDNTVKPDRQTSSKRIDGVASGLNALAMHLAQTAPEEEAEPNIRVIGA